jgi:hypothetical protein
MSGIIVGTHERNKINQTYKTELDIDVSSDIVAANANDIYINIVTLPVL